MAAEVTRSVVACELGISVAQHNKVCFSLTLQSNEGLGDGGSDPVPSIHSGVSDSFHQALLQFSKSKIITKDKE